jgi:hypothetical protein
VGNVVASWLASCVTAQKSTPLHCVVIHYTTKCDAESDALSATERIQSKLVQQPASDG